MSTTSSSDAQPRASTSSPSHPLAPEATRHLSATELLELSQAPSPYAEEGFRAATLEELSMELALRLELTPEAIRERGPWRGWIASLGPLELHGRPQHALLLHAHGAGAGRENDFHQQFGRACGDEGLAWLAFDFGYLLQMRCAGKRRPPPRLPGLIDELATRYEAVLSCLAVSERLAQLTVLVGGKSMGSRVASHLLHETTGAEAMRDIRQIPHGWYALGYPFHPTGKPEKLRIAHLPGIQASGIICQGTRDPFGTQQEVTNYSLPGTLGLHWLKDGEHDFKPRKASGETQEGLIFSSAKAIADFACSARR